MRRISVFILLFMIISAYTFAYDQSEDTNSDGEPDRWVKINAGKVSEIALDRDFNSEIDYIVKYDDESRKIEEQMDYNFDGMMDDFYYYAAEKMVRREIDSNYDEKVDIWVYLDGIYIQKYEKDTDFDGTVDVVEDYLEE